jgi:hypothetical protein
MEIENIDYKDLEGIIRAFEKYDDKLSNEQRDRGRGELARRSALFLPDEIASAEEDFYNTEAEMNRLEGILRKREYDNLVENGYSKSAAETLAGKLAVAHPDYITAKRAYGVARGYRSKIYEFANKVNQCLHTMKPYTS